MTLIISLDNFEMSSYFQHKTASEWNFLMFEQMKCGLLNMSCLLKIEKALNYLFYFVLISYRIWENM